MIEAGIQLLILVCHFLAPRSNGKLEIPCEEDEQNYRWPVGWFRLLFHIILAFLFLGDLAYYLVFWVITVVFIGKIL